MIMKKPIVSIICSINKNRAIGKNNQLLWHIPADLAYFKKITTGHPILMGQKTYESIGRPLPQRKNIVITLDKNYSAPGCIVCFSIEEAINKAKELDGEEVFIIGGGQIYNQTIGLADKLYLTIVDGDYEADTFFPDYSDFKKVVFEQKTSDSQYDFKFIQLEKE
jgi:dihydrofolate reductase